MPTYDYRCDRCGADFELWQSMKDDTLTVCPITDGPRECTAPGEGSVKKVFSSVGISFKGDGFYKNDHGANASGRRSESTDTSSSSADASSKDSSSKESSSKDSSSTDSSSGKNSSSSTSTSPSTGSSSSTSGSSSSD